MIKPRLFNLFSKYLALLLILVSVIGFTPATQAQQNVVTGKVIDKGTGESMPGVNVFVKGQAIGTVTDVNGSFSLNVGAPNAILVFSFIGMKTQEVNYSGQSVVDITMEMDVQALEEIVVVGYGTQSRADITTSISTVDSEAITAFPVGRIDDALEGRAAGVQVRSGGAPGEETQIAIRGLNTFGNGAPLIVVDGIFVESITQINPASVESINILKDAAASAIYGSRASNGVVIITTKKGERGAPKFTFHTFAGAQYLPESKLLDVINGDDLVRIAQVEDVSLDQNIETPTRFDEPGFTSANTDWQPLIYETAPIASYDIGLSGGSETVRYNLQAGIFDQDGIQIETGLTRYTFNINTEFMASDRVKIGQTLNLGFSEFSRPEQDGGRFVQEWTYYGIPYLPVTAPDGRFVAADRDLDAGTNPINNPLLIQATQNNEERKTTALGSLYGEVEIIEGLTNKIQLGVDLFFQSVESQRDLFGDDVVLGNGGRDRKTIIKNRNQSLQTTLTNVLTYDKTFGDHGLNVAAIVERFDRTLETVFINQVSEVSNAVEEIDASTGLIATTEELPETLLSYALRANYDFKGKYLVSASIRRDCSSKFDDPCGYFGGASLGWILSDESFLQDNPVISNLKMKASLGTTGNNNIPPFSFDPGIALNFDAIINGELTPGTALLSPASTGLTWETSLKRNVGVDLGLFDNQITFSAEYFDNQSQDLLVSNNLALSSGFPEDPIANLGEVSSEGLEFTLGYNQKIGDVQLNFWGNLSMVDVVVDRVNADDDVIRQLQVNSFPGVNLNLIQRGEPLYGIVGYVTDGLFTTENDLLTAPLQEQQFFAQNPDGSLGGAVSRTFDADGNAVFTDNNGVIVPIESVTVNSAGGTALGDIRYRDINNDGIINSDDRMVIGDPNPDFIYSFNINASYKGFDLSLFASGVHGVDVVNAAGAQARFFTGLRSFDSEILDRYTPENTDTSVPRYAVGDPGNNSRMSDRFIEDGSYLRLKNITLGYTLPATTLGKFLGGGLSKLRVYVSSQNLVTLTSYSGPDPEIRPSYGITGSIIGYGVDQGFAPNPTTFIGGLQVEF